MTNVTSIMANMLSFPSFFINIKHWKLCY